jgi:hypothetical protein
LTGDLGISADAESRTDGKKTLSRAAKSPPLWTASEEAPMVRE